MQDVIASRAIARGNRPKKYLTNMGIGLS